MSWMAGLAAMAAAGSVAAAEPVTNTSFVEADGDRVLQLSTVVPAPPAAVWRAITTADGWKRLGVQMAVVDFRVGGVIETNYKPDARPGERANIKNQIVAYVPERMLAIRNVQAPPSFPHFEEFSRTATVFELEPAGAGATRVRLTGMGFAPGPAYDALYALFEAGNTFSLARFRDSFAGGKTPPATAAGAAPTVEKK